VSEGGTRGVSLGPCRVVLVPSGCHSGDMHRVVGSYVGGELVIVIDCARLDRAAHFWCTLLGYVRAAEAAEDDRYLRLLPLDGNGVEVLLQRVPDEKVAKNRVHIDLRTANLQVEVQRAMDAGANLVTEEPIGEDGWLWHVLTDPDGNEFCVLQPPVHRREAWHQTAPGPDEEATR
jgi:predicted enzyme related to lactoylglutathione lyase